MSCTVKGRCCPNDHGYSHGHSLCRKKQRLVLRSNGVEGRFEAGSIKCRELQVQAIHYPQKVQGLGRHLQGTHLQTLWGQVSCGQQAGDGRWERRGATFR